MVKVRCGLFGLSWRIAVTASFPSLLRFVRLGALWAALCLGLGAAPALAQTVNYDLSSTSVMRIKLPVSQAVTVVISDAVGKIVSADPNIADAQPITDKSLYLVGKSFGTTTVNLFWPRVRRSACWRSRSAP